MAAAITTKFVTTGLTIVALSWNNLLLTKIAFLYFEARAGKDVRH
jgi:hypothetical protein